MHARNVFGGAALACLLAGVAHAESNGEILKFSVTRDGTQIGTNTIDVVRKGGETNVQVVTHVEVGLAFITLYRYDQTETERWNNGHLISLSSVTDDNGTVHRTSASPCEGGLLVQGDGGAQKLAPTVVPASIWNPEMLSQNVVLNPVDGKLVAVSVVDRGEDALSIDGRTERAHHYMVKTVYSEDLWYDDAHRLVKMELKGSDGSTIRYQLT
ncbi:MAG TPA: DUF6134 family protein [Rhizomicrobium sp.]|nr:DUF6134 family protein [Rhizomicrobium sp.]